MPPPRLALPPEDVISLTPLHGRPQNLTTLVYDALRDAIVSKALAPGQRLSEAALAGQLQVSKTPVREALLRLLSIGLVTPDDNRGLRVVEPSPELIREAYEVRAAHESLAAQLAANRGDDAAKERLSRAADASYDRATQGDTAGFREWDFVFHHEVAGAAHNELLATLVNNSFVLTWALRKRDVPIADDAVDCSAQHLRIAEAIQGQDGSRAAAEMVAHIDQVKRIVLAAVASDSVKAS
jgi:DNA-binding GntR family transcriptional regulator